MRSFETRGPVYPEDNYVVARTDELSDFINRLEKGRYVVLFAPRQTGKTTFFHRALETLRADLYFPIHIDFQSSNNLEPAEFYEGLYEDIREEIEAVFQRRRISSSAALTDFLDNTKITNHLSMRRFFDIFQTFSNVIIVGRKSCLSLTNLMGSRELLLVIFFIHSAIFTSLVGIDARTASVSWVSRALGNSTTIALSHLSISKTSSNCPTSRLNRSANSFPNTQTKWGSPLRLPSLNLSTNRRLDSPLSSTGSPKSLPRRWTSRKANQSRWNTFQKHTGSSFVNGTRIRSIW